MAETALPLARASQGGLKGQTFPTLVLPPSSGVLHFMLNVKKNDTIQQSMTCV